MTMSRTELPQSPRTLGESSRLGQRHRPDLGVNDLEESIERVDAIDDGCGFAIHDFDSSAELLKADPADGAGPDERDERRERSSREDWAEDYTVTNGTQQRSTWTFEHPKDLADALALSEGIELRAATIVASCYRCPKCWHEIAGSNETASWHRRV
jgi:hypothetical protein